MSLEQDYTTVPGQLFACISLVGPDCPQKTEKFGLKIRGYFNFASSLKKRNNGTADISQIYLEES